MDSAGRRRAFKIVVPIAAAGLGFGLFEAVWAVTRPLKESPEHQFWKFDSELGWSHRANETGVFQSERLGFRNEIALDAFGLRDNGNGFAGPFDKTVLIVGDSVTAGFEVKSSETFASVLERRLRAAGKRWRVLNAGVRGYGTDQALLTARRLVPAVKPDLVVYMFAWNDLTDNVTIKNFYRVYSKPAFALDASGALTPFNLPASPLPKGRYDFVYVDKSVERIQGDFDTSGTIEWVRGHLRSYELVEQLYYRYVVKPPTLPDTGRIPTDYPPRLFRALLREMKKECPKLLVASFVSNKAAARDKLEIARGAALELGLPFADLRSYFVPEAEEFIIPEDGHWNARGHAAAAAALFDRLQRL
ncbi:MAG: hypothetical protein HY078_16230 [Elusimicrobia bacterium]|nr:hypothetical protein [Elusimicrobiota bacterium]